MVPENQPFIRKIHSKCDDVEPLDRRVRKKWHLDIFNRRRRTGTPKIRTALSRSCPAGQTDNGQLFSKIPDRIRIADRFETDKIRTERHRTVFFTKIRTKSRHRTWFSTKCIIQLPTLNSYGQIRETKSNNWDITKRYFGEQDFSETRFLSETSRNVRLKLEILIETGPPIICR